MRRSANRLLERAASGRSSRVRLSLVSWRRRCLSVAFSVAIRWAASGAQSCSTSRIWRFYALDVGRGFASWNSLGGYGSINGFYALDVGRGFARAFWNIVMCKLRFYALDVERGFARDAFPGACDLGVWRPLRHPPGTVARRARLLAPERD